MEGLKAAGSGFWLAAARPVETGSGCSFPVSFPLVFNRAARPRLGRSVGLVGSWFLPGSGPLTAARGRAAEWARTTTVYSLRAVAAWRLSVAAGGARSGSPTPPQLAGRNYPARRQQLTALVPACLLQAVAIANQSGQRRVQSLLLTKAL